MNHELQVFDDVESLAIAAATYVAERSRAVEDREAAFTVAVSGGKSPWIMLGHLAKEPLPWEHWRVFQVDERAVTREDDARNLKHIEAALGPTSVPILEMEVDDPDLFAAADRYADLLPDTFDLIHLGLGPDGHCASLVPHDPVLQVTDRRVAVSGPYQGTMRLTLTYPALSRTRQLLWLVSGEDKRDALAKLLAGDRSIPAGAVEAPASLVMADRAAMAA
jgi:6-phosphogluconolactonase